MQGSNLFGFVFGLQPTRFVVPHSASANPSAHAPDLTLLVAFQALPERREAFTALMREVQANLPQAPGCLGVQVHTVRDHPDQFVLLEHWTSAEHHAAHIAQLNASGEWQALAQHLAQPPDVRQLDTLA